MLPLQLVVALIRPPGKETRKGLGPYLPLKLRSWRLLAFGEVHAKWTRNHKRKRVREVVSGVERHLCQNGLWLHMLSRVAEAPEGTAAIERSAAERQAKLAA